MKELLNKVYGLKNRNIVLLFLLGLFSGLVCISLYFISDSVLYSYFKKNDFKEKSYQHLTKNLQNYISEKKITLESISSLYKWEIKKPVFLLQFFYEGECVYSTSDNEGKCYDYDFNPEKNSFNILLNDGRRCDVFIYSDYTYQYYVIAEVSSVIVSFIIFVVFFIISNSWMIKYICKLSDEVHIIKNGDLDYEISVYGNDEITDLAQSLDEMRKSLKEQFETEQRIFRQHKALLTQMSHDLRTPLTGILLYTEILKNHKYKNEVEMDDFIRRIEKKSQNLKFLTDSLFEYSLSKDIKKRGLDRMSGNQLVENISGFINELDTYGYEITQEFEDFHGFVRVYPESLCRIFENLTSNIRKYADKDESISIYTVCSDKYYGFSVVNSYKENVLLEDSNKIGIESIKNLITKMDGYCTVEKTNELFEVSMMFLIVLK